MNDFDLINVIISPCKSYFILFMQIYIELKWEQNK